MKNDIARQLDGFESKLGFYCSRLLGYPLTAPEHVYFSLTNRCNLQCRMCSIGSITAKEEDEIPTAKVKEIILEIKELGIEHLIFSGGEPLLRKDLLELIEFSVSAGIKMVDIITNGQLLDDNIIQQMISLGLNHITFSLDGMATVADEIRGQGVFAKAEHNIDRFNYYKSKASCCLPTVGINFTIMDENIDDILPMIDFAQSKKCNIVVFQPVLFDNIKMDENRLNPLWPKQRNILKLETILNKVKSLKAEQSDCLVYTDDNILDAMPGFFSGRRVSSRFKCYEAIKRIVITCSGDVWSCKGVYGNLLKSSLRDVWGSEAAKQIRNSVSKCRQHCLQDCVYFPYDPLRDVENLLQELDEVGKNTKEQSKKHLLRAINKIDDILPRANFLWFANGKISRAKNLLAALRKILART